jgi:hypothetical protein
VFPAQPDTGVLYGQQAIALAKKGNNKKGEAFAMFSYGWALWSFGDYDKAVDFSLKSLKLFQDRRDYEMMVSVNNLLAVILRDVKDYRMALSYSNTAKKLTDSLGFYNKSVVLSASPGVTFAIRSSVFHLSGQIDSADYYMKKFFPGNPQNYGAFPVALMGRIAMAKKDYSKALLYFKTSIPTALNRIDILDTYTGMADLYLETGKTDSSIYYCKEVLRLSYHGLRAKDKSFNATLQTDFDESIEKINIIPQDIVRVLLNLFNNAFYAITEKKKSPCPLKGDNYEPTVSVTTKRINSPLGGGGKIEIHVKDNGVGIPQKVVDKIFQPFFTTKPTGQGTGLGLSLSYDIVKAHGGEIKVETKEGEGSEFMIQLPV